MAARKSARSAKTAQPPALNISSLDELIKSEPAIVRRINDTPNGGRLFIADPLRLLKDINVNLTAAAQRQVEAKLGADALASNPLKRVYDDFQRDADDTSVKITIRGIVPKDTPALGAARHA